MTIFPVGSLRFATTFPLTHFRHIAKVFNYVKKINRMLEMYIGSSYHELHKL